MFTYVTYVQSSDYWFETFASGNMYTFVCGCTTFFCDYMGSYEPEQEIGTNTCRGYCFSLVSVSWKKVLYR